MNTNEPTTPSDAPDEHKCGFLCNHCKQQFPGYVQYWEHKCNSEPPLNVDKELENAYDESDLTGIIRRLERERDEARAELAKLKTPQSGVMPAISNHGVTEIVQQPPTEGSAVEWVTQKMRTEFLWGGDALELARRADEAEAKHAHFIYRNVRHKLAEQECDQLRAQLAAAQARADLEADNARQSREEIEALKGDVAAMAENQGEWMRRAMAFEAQLAAAQAEATALRVSWHNAQAEVERLREENNALKEALPWCFAKEDETLNQTNQ